LTRVPARRLTLLVLAAIAAVALVVAASGRTPEPRDEARPRAPGATLPGGVSTLAETPAPPPPPARPASTPRFSASWRAAELRRLHRTRSVAGALRRAWLAGRIDRITYDTDTRIWGRATAAARTLSGAPAVEQRGAVAVIAGLARARELSAARLPVAMLTLRRNTEYWPRHEPPAPKTRFVIGRDPVVLRYEPGQGLQIHWLGTWGRANARAGFCLHHARRCPRATVTRELDRLVGLAGRRAGYAAYEELYRYGAGAPGWVSGMVQGTAVQALARGRRAFGAPRFGLAARRALGAFEQAPPAGIAVREGGGHHYLMYSFDPGMRILNGDLQAVTGLYDMAKLTGSARARRLYRRGERAARGDVRRFDTGAWSLYSADGDESTLAYHQLVDGFLGGLCDRTHRRAYCGAARRFARYEREPPRVTVARRRRPRAEAGTTVAFALSKGARVDIAIRGPRGVVLRRGLTLGRGAHRLAWRPAVPGRYRVRIVAQGVSGPRGWAASTVRVGTSARVLAARRRAAHRRRAAAARRRAAARREVIRARARQASASAAAARRRALEARRRATGAALAAPVV
jgi:D-glucuronyl C5-epimerase C-terminus